MTKLTKIQSINNIILTKKELLIKKLYLYPKIDIKRFIYGRCKLDEIDIKLIRMLQNDARTSFKDIAKASNVSIDTIKNRFKNLKKAGVFVVVPLF